MAPVQKLTIAFIMDHDMGHGAMGSAATVRRCRVESMVCVNEAIWTASMKVMSGGRVAGDVAIRSLVPFASEGCQTQKEGRVPYRL